MAIIELLPGVEATIEVEDIALHEYTDDTIKDDDRTATRFVEVQSGKEFVVAVKVKGGTNLGGAGLVINIYVNGIRTEWTFWEWYRFQHGPLKIKNHGLTEPGFSLRKFRFSELEIIEDAPRAKGAEKEKLKDLGLIKIEIQHILSRKNAAGYIDIGTAAAKNPKVVKSVAEKDVKGNSVSHTIEFAAVDPNTDNGPTGAKKLKNYTDTYASPSVIGIFNFNYRSLEGLKAQGVVARTPSPEPLENRDPSTLTQEEMRVVLAENKALKEAAAKVKRERTDDDGDQEQRPKRPRPSGEIEVVVLD